MACTITIGDKSYNEKQFKNLLKTGLLYESIERGLIALPVDTTSIVAPETQITGLRKNFPYTKEDVVLAGINIFGLSSKAAKANAEILDRMAASFAFRKNKTKEDFYKTITFIKPKDVTIVEGNKDILYSTEDLSAMEREKKQVEKDYKYKLYKSPNGQNTNLTKDQWLTVRTPTFKAWFGDWEKGEGSKALDKNNEPKVFYHGSDVSWDIFDPEIARSKSAFKTGALFVSPEIEFAEGYIKTKEGNITEFFIKSNTPFDYENVEHLNLLKETDKDLYTKLKNEILSDNWKVIETDRFQEFLKNNLFDGFYVSEWGIKNLATFNPNSAKVSDGRNQTFLESNPNILFQSNSQTLYAVTQGFKLIPSKNGFGTAFKTKTGKANKELASRINLWMQKENLKGYKFYYESTYGTINAIPLQSENTLFQQAKAAILLGQEGLDIIYALTNPDGSSMVHEFAHKWQRELNDSEVTTILEWAGTPEWTEETSEKWARGFEKYLSEGVAPFPELKKLFDNFKAWLTEIYIAIVGSPIDVELNPEMRNIYASMLGADFQTTITEKVANEQEEVGSGEFLTEKQIATREKLRIDDVVDRVEGGDIKGSNVSVGDKDLTEHLVDNGLDGREAYIVKDMVERLIKPLQRITDKIDTKELDFFTENVEDINSVVEGLEDARNVLFSRNKDVVDGVNEEAKRLLDYYSDKNNLSENKLDNEKTFAAKVDLLNKFLNGEVNYLDLSKLGVEKKAKDYYKQKEKKPTPKEETKTPSVKEEVGSGVGGDVETKQQIENFGVNKEDVEPVHSVISQVFDGLKKSGLTAAKTVGDWVGIGKGGVEKPYTLKMNGKDVQVKNISTDVVNGFYSQLEKVITETKFNKLPAKQWIEKYANSEEARWTGLKDWLAQQQGSVSKEDIQKFLKENRIEVVEVGKGSEVKELTDKEIKDAVYTDSKEWVDLGNGVKVRNINGSNVRISINGSEETTNFIEAENKIHKALNTDNRQTKFSQYQLEGEKSHYAEKLIILPNKEINIADFVDNNTDYIIEAYKKSGKLVVEC